MHVLLTPFGSAGDVYPLIGILRQAREQGCSLDPDDVTYYVARETIIHRGDGKGLAEWEEALFAAMERNAVHVSDFFSLPRDSVVEIGRQVAI